MAPTTKPPLMTVGEFKRRTYNGPFSRRSNPLIKDIDHLLQLYNDPKLSPSQHVKILATLYIWCIEYLRGGGSRSEGVGELLEQVGKACDSDYVSAVLAARNKGMRWENKVKGTPGHTPQGPVKSLEQPYKAETVLPGKGSVAGYKLQHHAKRYNVPSYRDEALDLLNGSRDWESRKQYQQLIGVDDEFVATYGDKASEMLVAKLPLSGQLDLLSRAMAFDSKQAGHARRQHFEYCTSKERTRYLVHILDGRFYRDARKHHPYHTGQEQAIYAVDEYGRMYVKMEKEMGAGGFNHSSFMRGRPVKCAGNLSIENGMLKMIDNGSGHYRPSAENLKEVLRVLHYEKNVSLMDVTVRRCDLPKQNGQYVSLRAWDVFWG